MIKLRSPIIFGVWTEIFQHLCHLAASCKYEEKKVMIPPLFIDAEKVAEWAPGGVERYREKAASVCCHLLKLNVSDSLILS